MWSRLIEVVERFGLPAAFCVVLIYFLKRMEERSAEERKDHRLERGEWREMQTRLQTDTNGALKELTTAIGHLERKIKH